jgi:hypothetical protein
MSEQQQQNESQQSAETANKTPIIPNNFTVEGLNDFINF